MLKKLGHISGFVWAASIAFFFGFAYISIPESGRYSNFQNITLTVILLTGVLSFLLAIGFYFIYFLRKELKDNKNRKHNNIRVFTNPFFYMVLGLFFFICLVSVSGLFLLNNVYWKAQVASITPTPDIVVPSTQPATSYIESDPVISCQNSNCGEIKIKKSLCSDTVGYVCCQIGSAWTWYASRDQCASDQKTQTPNAKSNLVQCHVYGQTFNLTPEKCHYYQQEESGGVKVGNSGIYTSPDSSGNSQTSSPAPTIPADKYQSYQADCERKCDETYKYYSQTSKFRQQCYDSCKSYPPY